MKKNSHELRRLLVVTQAVDLDDPSLGFFHDWLVEFAKHLEYVEVICLKEGRHQLPANVLVHSLGKERGRPTLGVLVYILRFERLTWKLRNGYDGVFVHMNPEYAFLGGLLWRFCGKRVVLWYAHRQITLRLRLGMLFAHTAATTSIQSLRIRSRKVVVCGHGIAVERFAAIPPKHIDTRTPRLTAIGRTAPIKDLVTIINAIAFLRKNGMDATLELIGGPLTESDFVYEKRLYELVDKLGITQQVIFRGVISYSMMPDELLRYALLVNASPSGGVDKVVLESMAAGIPVLVSNDSFATYLEELMPRCSFRHGDAEHLAEQAHNLLESSDLPAVQARVRALAKEHASIVALVKKFVALFA